MPFLTSSKIWEGCGWQSLGLMSNLFIAPRHTAEDKPIVVQDYLELASRLIPELQRRMPVGDCSRSSDLRRGRRAGRKGPWNHRYHISVGNGNDRSTPRVQWGTHLIGWDPGDAPRVSCIWRLARMGKSFLMIPGSLPWTRRFRMIRRLPVSWRHKDFPFLGPNKPRLPVGAELKIATALKLNEICR